MFAADMLCEDDSQEYTTEPLPLSTSIRCTFAACEEWATVQIKPRGGYRCNRCLDAMIDVQVARNTRLSDGLAWNHDNKQWMVLLSIAGSHGYWCSIAKALAIAKYSRFEGGLTRGEWASNVRRALTASKKRRA